VTKYYVWPDDNGFWWLVRDVSEAWGKAGLWLEIGTVYQNQEAAEDAAMEDAQGPIHLTVGKEKP
jgi:hypothetical protein